MKKKINKFAGFTLIELMITVAIIGILSAIALPSYIDTVRKARRSDGFDALLHCATEQARYYSSNSPPSYLDSATADNASVNACGWDGTAFTSEEGHYTLAITNPGCTGGNSLWCFTLTATPVGGQANDTTCATLTLDHRGVKASLDSTPADSTDLCWRD